MLLQQKIRLSIFLLLSLSVIIPLTYADTEQGFTVTSVSLANILHPGQSASETQWLITIVLNGGGQSIVGNIGNSTVNYQGFTSAYPLQISGTTNPEQAFYQIYNTNPQPIYTFSAQLEQGTLSTFLGQITGASPAPDCSRSPSFVGEKDFSTQGWLVANGTMIIDRICIYQNVVGYEAPISGTPNIQSSSTLQFSANGKQESLNLNYNQQSATSSDGLVQANWVGSLVTGNAAPGGNLYDAINDPKQNSWIVQSQSTYNAYSSSYSSTKSQASTETYNTNSLPNVCLSLVQNINSQTPTDVGNCLLNNVVQPSFSVSNSNAQNLMSGSVQIGNSDAQFTNNNGQSSFVITLNNNFVNNQEVTLRMNGAFIGVVIPLGTPKILSVTSAPFNSGNNGSIEVSVENIGNAQGSFYTSLSNCPGISTGSSAKYAVDAGQSQTISIPIYTSSSTQILNEQCTVTVTDYNGGGTDSAQVTVQSKPANQCSPSDIKVEGNYICPCVNVNGVYQVATGSQCTNCPYGVLSSSSGFSCASAPVNTGTNQTVNVGALTNINLSAPIEYTVDINNLNITSISATVHNVKNVRSQYCNGNIAVPFIDWSARDIVESVPGADYISGKVCSKLAGSVLDIATTGLDILTSFQGAK